MDEEQVDTLFARYVEHLVLHGAHLDVGELASGDSELAAALRERIQAFQKIDEALDRRLQPLTGRTLGRYNVLEKLGAGGMGEVYRAKDKDLGRDVAVKVLPPVFALDPERRTRFEREARILAALDHRNIGAIHGLERADGLQFLVLEMVQGETLEERIGRGPLPLGEALPLFQQMARALEAAHGKGIIHRDLKPANVKITPDGTVKVLDFGLGKSLGAQEAKEPGESVGSSPEGTVTGVVLGTASYMSPEQARGERVDHRTDIFSFGVVFQEMLSGKNPFKRERSAETLVAILKESPAPLSASRRDIAADTLSKLQRVIDKCLAKDPAERYQAIKDLLLDLEWVGRDSESQVAARRPATQGGKRVLLAASLVGVVLMGAVVYLLWLRHEPVPVLSNPVQVTRSIGAEECPTWAPEGGRLAYHLNTKGDELSFDIWVAQVSGGQAVNLTDDHPGVDRHPSWSPDGNQIAFWSDRQGGGYFVMSALGGPARKVAGGAPSSDSWWGWWATRPQWSTDGQELAAVVYEQEKVFVEIVSLGSGESRRLLLAGGKRSRLDPTWSRDRRYFAYLDGTIGQVTELRVLRVEGQETFAVTEGRTTVWSPSWSSDGRYLYFVSNRGGGMDLWRQRMRDGRAVGDLERVTTGTGMTSAAFSPDGNRLAYSRGRSVSNVWRVPILKDRPATWAEAQQITFDEALINMVDVSRDGRRLLVTSDRAGNRDLWMLPIEGGEMQQVTTDPTPDEHPAWSPDGMQIAFCSNRSGNWEIWVQPIAGGLARQLTKGEGEQVMPAWSPDGQSVLYASRRSGNQDIWSMPAVGGEPRQLIAHPKDDRKARWSPDGKWLVFYSTRSGSDWLWRARADGSRPESLEAGYSPNWSLDGKWIYYVSLGEPTANVWAVTVDGQAKRPMTDLRGRRGSPGPSQGALTADGSYFYFVWQEDLGDIWIADVTYPGLWY